MYEIYDAFLAEVNSIRLKPEDKVNELFVIKKRVGI